MNNIIQLNQIPKIVIIAGVEIKLQDRFLSFMRGKACPIEGYYLHDVLAWIDFEGIVNLRDYCQF